MGLPVASLPTSKVEVNGAEIEYRGLSRSEVVKIYEDYTGKPDAAEIFIIAKGCGVTEEEAAAWREVTEAREAGKLIDGIIILSGLATSGGKDPQ